MIFKEKLDRINKLAQKEKKDGLTTKEKEEQQNLRKEYLQNVRKSFTNQFKTMTVMDKEGNDVTPQKVKDIQKEDKDN